jgi:hypothetical protein
VNRFRLGGMVVVAAMLMGGCTDTPSAERPTASASGTVPEADASTTSPASDVSVPITRNLSTADAADVKTSDLKRNPVLNTRSRDGSYLTPDILRDDGTVIAEKTPKYAGSTTDWDVVISRETLGFLASGRFTPFASSQEETLGALRGKMRQITSVEADERYVVWAETPSTELNYCEWVLRVYDSKSKKVRTIARSQLLKGKYRLICTYGDTRPLILDKYAYWSTAVALVGQPNPKQKSHWSFDIQRARLDGSGEVETVVQNGVLPAVDGNALYYVTNSVSESLKPVAYDIHRRTQGEASSDEVIVSGVTKGDSRVTNMSAEDGNLVWTISSERIGKEGWDPDVSAPGHLYVLNEKQRTTVKVTLRDPASINYSIAMGAGRVMWGNGSGNGNPGQYLLDLQSFKLWRLGENQGASLVLTAPATGHVMWAVECPSSPQFVCWRSGEWRH